MLKYKQSKQAHGEELNFFSLPKTNSAIEDTKFVDYSPTSALNYGQAIVWNIIPGTFTDLTKTRLKLRCKLVQGDGKDLGKWPDNNVTLNKLPSGDYQASAARGLFYNLFSHADLNIAGTNTCSQISKLPYKCFFDNILKKKSPTWSSTFFDIEDETFTDTPYFRLPNLVSSIDKSEAEKLKTEQMIFNRINRRGVNEGLMKRAKQLRQSREIVLQGPLLLDILECKKYLMHNTKIQLILYPEKAAFYVMSEYPQFNFRIEILEATLSLCHVTLSPATVLAINEVFQEKPIVLPIEKSVLKTYTISKGSRQETFNSVYDSLPDSVVIGIVSAEGFTGSYERNPFCFANYNLSLIGFELNNVPVPHKHFKLRYENSLEDSEFSDGFLNLHTAGEDLTITKSQYFNHLALYYFDLTQRGKELLSIKRQGNVSLKLEFSQPLPESVCVVMYSKQSHMLSLDSGYNLSL